MTIDQQSYINSDNLASPTILFDKAPREYLTNIPQNHAKKFRGREPEF